MKVHYSIIFFCLLIVAACNTKTTNKSTENKIEDKYPFVEFDSMLLISIDSKDFYEQIDSVYNYGLGSNHLIVSNYMKKPLEYSAHTCSNEDISKIIDFLSVDSIWKYENDVACAPMYRNAIVCYNKHKLVATTLICFDCQMFLFQPTKPNNDDDIFIEDIKIIKDVFEKNGLKAKHVFDQPEVSPPPPPSKSN